MRSRPRRSAAVLAFLFASSATAATAEVVERILAVVDGRPVMLTEVLLEERVLGVDRKKALDSVIDERLMYREAARVPQAAITPDEEEKAHASLGVRTGGRTVGLPEADLRVLARRQAVILKYARFRFLPQIRIDDPSQATEAGSEDRERLLERALGEKIEAWVRELRASADIRYNP